MFAPQHKTSCELCPISRIPIKLWDKFIESKGWPECLSSIYFFLHFLVSSFAVFRPSTNGENVKTANFLRRFLSDENDFHEKPIGNEWQWMFLEMMTFEKGMFCENKLLCFIIWWRSPQSSRGLCPTTSLMSFIEEEKSLFSDFAFWREMSWKR